MYCGASLRYSVYSMSGPWYKSLGLRIRNYRHKSRVRATGNTNAQNCAVIKLCMTVQLEICHDMVYL